MIGLTNEFIFKMILKKEKIDGHRERSIINKEERTPSLFIYYREDSKDYYFKDFSSGLHGDSIDYIAYKFFDGSVRKACLFVYTMYKNMRNGEQMLQEIIKQKEINTISFRKILSETYKNPTIIIKGYALTEYWINKHCLSPETIYLYNILQIDIPEEQDNNTKDKYLYMDKDGTYVQIYSPLAEKKNKFRTLCSFKSEPFGVKWITTQKNAIITSSIKDAICLYQYLYENKLTDFYIPVTYLSETPIDKDKVKLLNDKYGIEQVFVLYDFDEHGFSVSKKSEELSGIVNLTEKMNIRNKNNSKIDIADTRTNATLKQEMYNKIKELWTLI